MLDDRVRAVLERLQQEDADERERGLSAAERSRAVAPTTGQFLFALVAPQVDCEVLEIGASRGYSTLWLAAGVRYLGGRVLSIENDPAKAAAWRANIAEAGLDEWAELIEGDAKQAVPEIHDVFDVVFLDAEKEDYEQLFQAARPKLEPGLWSSPTTCSRTRRRWAPTRAHGRRTRLWRASRSRWTADWRSASSSANR